MDTPTPAAKPANELATPSNTPRVKFPNAERPACESFRPLSSAAVSAPNTTRSAPMTEAPAMSVRLSLHFTTEQQRPLLGDGEHFFGRLGGPVTDQKLAKRNALLAARGIGDEIGEAGASVVL